MAAGKGLTAPAPTVKGLGHLTAAAMADAIQFAALTFSGGRLSDDTVALVMKVAA